MKQDPLSIKILQAVIFSLLSLELLYKETSRRKGEDNQKQKALHWASHNGSNRGMVVYCPCYENILPMTSFNHFFSSDTKPSI